MLIDTIKLIISYFTYSEGENFREMKNERKGISRSELVKQIREEIKKLNSDRLSYVHRKGYTILDYVSDPAFICTDYDAKFIPHIITTLTAGIESLNHTSVSATASQINSDGGYYAETVKNPFIANEIEHPKLFNCYEYYESPPKPPYEVGTTSCYLCDSDRIVLLRDYNKNSPSFGASQVTKDGVYKLFGDTMAIIFFPNEAYKEVSERWKKSIDEVKRESVFVFFFLPGFDKPGVERKEIESPARDKETAAMLANKIFREGLDKIFAKGKIEITEEDRRFFQEEEEKLSRDKQPKIDSDKSNENIIVGVLSEEDAREMEAYKALEDAGILLSKEQKKEVAMLHEKAEKKAKLNTYREKAPEREQHQNEVLEAKRLANVEQNKKWEESFSESERKHNSEKEELEKMKKQAMALKTIMSMDPEMLTEEQKKLLSNNERFINYTEINDKHKDQEEMSSEVRQMMQEYYEEQEKDGRSR